MSDQNDIPDAILVYWGARRRSVRVPQASFVPEPTMLERAREWLAEMCCGACRKKNRPN